MKRVLFFASIFLFAFLPVNLNGQVQPDAVDDAEILEEDGLISDFEIYGLKKTQHRYVEQQINPFLGKKKSEVDAKKVELALRVTGLFSKQECSFQKNTDGSFTLVIHVEEKMSYIPLPFAMYSGSGLMFGGFLMNMNAFGMNDKLVTGGIYGPNSWTDWSPRMLMANFMFIKSPKGITRPGYSVHASVMKRTKEMVDENDDSVVPEFEVFAVKTGASLTHQINRKFSTRFGVNYAYAYPEDNFTLNHGFGGSVGLGLSSSSYNGWFLSTNSLSANSSFMYYTENGFMPSVQARAVSQLPLCKRIRFEGSLGYSQSWNTMWNEYDGGGSAGIAILPAKYVSDFLAGATAGFEFGVLNIKKGVLDIGNLGVYLKGEAVVSDDYDGDCFFDYGLTGGAKIYLSKINMPAFSFSWSWNMRRPLSQLYTFSIGISM